VPLRELAGAPQTSQVTIDSSSPSLIAARISDVVSLSR
jgi:hypothetical protein